MTYNKERLSKLEDHQLMDLVKNYRQYGLDNDTRNNAIDILGSRGLTVEDLKAGGNYENHTYTQAEELYRYYGKHSTTALVLYMLVFAIVILSSFLPILNSIGGLVLTSFLTIGYYVYLFKAYRNASDLNDIIGKGRESSGSMMHMIAGSPFYVITYFRYKKDIKAAMSYIR